MKSPNRQHSGVLSCERILDLRAFLIRHLATRTSSSKGVILLDGHFRLLSLGDRALAEARVMGQCVQMVRFRSSNAVNQLAEENRIDVYKKKIPATSRH